MNQHGTDYPIYNYPEFFTEHLFRDGSGSTPSPEHALVFVISGELTVSCSCGSSTISEGGYIFLRRDEGTTLERRSSGGKPFRSVFMGFNNCFLKKLNSMIDSEKFSSENGGFTDNVIELPQRPSLKSLYISLLPYLNSDTGPVAELLELKLMEAVYSLIQMDERFYSCLFDFDKPTDSQSVGEGGSYEKLISDSYYVTEQMDSSYIIIRDQGQVTDVYIDVTYRNVARFFNAYGEGLIFSQIN